MRQRWRPQAKEVQEWESDPDVDEEDADDDQEDDEDQPPDSNHDQDNNEPLADQSVSNSLDPVEVANAVVRQLEAFTAQLEQEERDDSHCEDE